MGRSFVPDRETSLKFCMLRIKISVSFRNINPKISYKHLPISGNLTSHIFRSARYIYLLGRRDLFGFIFNRGFVKSCTGKG